MSDTDLVNELPEKVMADTRFWTAWVGVIGGIVGGVLTIAGNILLHRLRERPKRALDKMRREILKKMLADERFPEKWRELDTLTAAIGADEEETKRQLIEVGARGSE